MRRGELLTLASELFAARGFANTTVDEIGAAASISGPALYHHFANKESILGEMLIDISCYLLAGAQKAVADGGSDVLERLVRHHATFAIDRRALIEVQFRDLVYANEQAQRRIRRLQATYANLWVRELMGRMLGLDRKVARSAVLSVFGLLNSTPYSRTLPRGEAIALLERLAFGAFRAASEPATPV